MDNLDKRVQKDVTIPKVEPNRPSITPVVKGHVRSASDDKKNIMTEILQPIVGRAVTDFAVTVMATISDIVIQTIDMKIFGESRHGRASSLIGRTNYNSLYRPTSTIVSGLSNLSKPIGSTSLSTLYHNPSNGFRVQEVLVQDRGEAELLIDTLCERLDMYGVVSVGDYYDLVGVPTTAIDFKYGWYNLAAADKRKTFDGYLIIMPTPKSIE